MRIRTRGSKHMAICICIRCGHEKPYALEECAACGFTPASSEDRAKSLILAETFDVGDEVFGRPANELSEIGARIRVGRPYAFDPSEVARVAAEHDAALATTSRELVVGLIKWLGPPILFLVGLYWLISLD